VTIIRVGTTQKYAQGWETAFGKGKKKSAVLAGKTPAGKTSSKSSSLAKSGKKTSAKKSTKKKVVGRKGNR